MTSAGLQPKQWRKVPSTHTFNIPTARPSPRPQLHRFLRERCLHNRLTEDQARWIFQQMIVGLDFCHRMVRGQEVLGGDGGASPTVVQQCTMRLRLWHCSPPLRLARVRFPGGRAPIRLCALVAPVAALLLQWRCCAEATAPSH